MGRVPGGAAEAAGDGPRAGESAALLGTARLGLRDRAGEGAAGPASSPGSAQLAAAGARRRGVSWAKAFRWRHARKMRCSGRLIFGSVPPWHFGVGCDLEAVFLNLKTGFSNSSPGVGGWPWWWCGVSWKVPNEQECVGRESARPAWGGEQRHSLTQMRHLGILKFIYNICLQPSDWWGSWVLFKNSTIAVSWRKHRGDSASFTPCSKLSDSPEIKQRCFSISCLPVSDKEDLCILQIKMSRNNGKTNIFQTNSFIIKISASTTLLLSCSGVQMLAVRQSCREMQLCEKRCLPKSLSCNQSISQADKK